MARATIILTAGHSDQKSGAVSPDGTIREANVCLMLRDEIARTLRGRGYTVVTDGPAGVNLSLNDAIKLARNHVGPELELHLNAGGGTGVEAYALPTQAKFAATIAQVVAQTLGLPLRGQAGWKDPSQSQHAKLGICNAGAVLLEVAFIDNREDMRRLFEYRQALADKLAGELGAWADGVYAQSVPAQHPPSIRPASAQRPPSVRPASAPRPAAVPAVQAAPIQSDVLPFAPVLGQVAAPPVQPALPPPVARRDGQKSLWTVVGLAVYQAIAAIVGWWQNVNKQVVFVALVVGVLLIGLAYLHRQTRLGLVRESRQ